MKTVLYKGPKSFIHVFLPIGAKSKGRITGTVKFQKSAELQDADADQLVAMDPDNFQIVEKAKPAKAQPAPEPVTEPAMESVPDVEMPEPKKRGRKAKVKVAE